MRLTGLSAFPLTPADAAGRVDVAAVGTLVGRLAAAQVASIGLLGSTGTYAYLTRDERRRTIDAALAAAGAVPVLVGVGALRTDDAVALAQDARAAGAAGGLLAPVSYTPLTEDEAFAHYAAVAESGLPIVIYDNPGTTHFRFSPALLGRIAHLPGVVAAKVPAPDDDAAGYLGARRAELPDGFPLGVSGDWNSVAALLAGADAWYCVFGGLFPNTALTLTRLAQSGDVDGARAQNARLEPLWALMRVHSGLRVMFAAAATIGIDAAPPRPILPLAADVRRQVAEVVARLDLD